jgi:hypothetical protein
LIPHISLGPQLRISLSGLPVDNAHAEVLLEKGLDEPAADEAAAADHTD